MIANHPESFSYFGTWFLMRALHSLDKDKELQSSISSGIDLFLERISFRYLEYAGISLSASVKGILIFKLLSNFTNFLYFVSVRSFLFLCRNGSGGAV